MGRDYSGYDRCPIHKCIMLIVQKDAEPRCLVEWLLERAKGQWVRDYVPREGYYGDLVLTNHLVLPVERMWNDSYNQNQVLPLWEAEDVLIRLKALSAFYLVDIGYGRTDEGDDLIMFKFDILNTGNHVLAKAQFDELFDVFFDEEIRKYEP